MQATIITIGDEILIGQTIDTNSAWLGQQLSLLGVQVYEILSISDEREHILNALRRASLNSGLVIVTGGLGPTKDDITKATIAEFFNAEMVLNEEIWKRIQAYFGKRGPQYVEMNKKLAYLPANCNMLSNEKGTAAGMWFYENRIMYISLPGVPHEMKEIMRRHGFSMIRKTADLPFIHHRHIMTAGVGETILADKLDTFEDNLPKHIKLAYLPNLGSVKLRLSGWGEKKEELISEVDKLTTEASGILNKYVYGYDEEELENRIGILLKEIGKTVGTAESCTGGSIAKRITSVSGSSAYFLGSVVSYSNEVKIHSLGVKEDTLKQHGAVSQAVVEQMCQGLRKSLKVDYAISVSGVAGPDGGTAEKPVGTVWMAVGDGEQTISRKYELTPNRTENIEIATTLALNLLRRFLTGTLKKH